uniref:Protein kinase domain-containing protein n=1 Tax=Rhabditophanes sp. KR3021 TaxID=114890 RepID=A0AC35U3J0_9BILA
MLGVEVHPNVSFKKVLDPHFDKIKKIKKGYCADVSPSNHPVSYFEFDFLIGGDGKRRVLTDFIYTSNRCKLAIGLTASFKNFKTINEEAVSEISGIARHCKPEFFVELEKSTGCSLENAVYYKDETHYFVMCATKKSLLKKGVLRKDCDDIGLLLSSSNIQQENLIQYVTDVAKYMTDGKLTNLQFALTHKGKPDVSVFDFTTFRAAAHSTVIYEKAEYNLASILVGDCLNEPFWPTGSGIGRGFFSVFDGAYFMKELCLSNKHPLEAVKEKEFLTKLLFRATQKDLRKKYAQYTIDPQTRYSVFTNTTLINEDLEPSTFCKFENKNITHVYKYFFKKSRTIPNNMYKALGRSLRTTNSLLYGNLKKLYQQLSEYDVFLLFIESIKLLYPKAKELVHNKDEKILVTMSNVLMFIESTLKMKCNWNDYESKLTRVKYEETVLFLDEVLGKMLENKKIVSEFFKLNERDTLLSKPTLHRTINSTPLMKSKIKEMVASVQPTTSRILHKRNRQSLDTLKDTGNVSILRKKLIIASGDLNDRDNVQRVVCNLKSNKLVKIEEVENKNKLIMQNKETGGVSSQEEKIMAVRGVMRKKQADVNESNKKFESVDNILKNCDEKYSKNLGGSFTVSQMRNNLKKKISQGKPEVPPKTEAALKIAHAHAHSYIINDGPKDVSTKHDGPEIVNRQSQSNKNYTLHTIGNSQLLMKKEYICPSDEDTQSDDNLTKSEDDNSCQINSSLNLSEEELWDEFEAKLVMEDELPDEIENDEKITKILLNFNDSLQVNTSMSDNHLTPNRTNSILLTPDNNLRAKHIISKISKGRKIALQYEREELNTKVENLEIRLMEITNSGYDIEKCLLKKPDDDFLIFSYFHYILDYKKVQKSIANIKTCLEEKNIEIEIEKILDPNCKEPSAKANCDFELKALNEHLTTIKKKLIRQNSIESMNVSMVKEEFDAYYKKFKCHKQFFSLVLLESIHL